MIANKNDLEMIIKIILKYHPNGKFNMFENIDLYDEEDDDKPFTMCLSKWSIEASQKLEKMYGKEKAKNIFHNVVQTITKNTQNDPFTISEKLNQIVYCPN